MGNVLAWSKALAIASLTTPISSLLNDSGDVFPVVGVALAVHRHRCSGFLFLGAHSMLGKISQAGYRNFRLLYPTSVIALYHQLAKIACLVWLINLYKVIDITLTDSSTGLLY